MLRLKKRSDHYKWLSILKGPHFAEYCHSRWLHSKTASLCSASHNAHWVERIAHHRRKHLQSIRQHQANYSLVSPSGNE
jgi:hypothetical protein